MGCHFLLQGIFPTQGLNVHLCASYTAGRFFTTEPPGKPQVINDAQISVAYNNKGLFLAHATWRRKWQPTPVFLPGEFLGQRSLTGYSLWGRKESDTTERLSLFPVMHWRRQWQPTPVFLPGESQGRRSLVGFHLWVRTELDTTEAT